MPIETIAKDWIEMGTQQQSHDQWQQNTELRDDPHRPNWAELEKMGQIYSDSAIAIPMEAIIKEDLLRAGIAFSSDALKIASGFKPKAYFIFSFDLTPISEMKQQENLHSPEEIRISNGPFDLEPTIISVRNSGKSPYLIDLQDGQLALFLENKYLANIELPRTPAYYNKKLKNGKPLPEVTPTIEWGYLIYLTIFRLCQYWGKEEECLFCDINENYRQQKSSGRPYHATKSVDEIIEALDILTKKENNTRAYTITGGSITSTLQGKDEAQFYLPIAQAIEEKYPKKWISKIVLQALPKSDLAAFQQTGIQIYHPNFEVWDKKLFSALCPGKERYVGRELWHERILDSAEIFGTQNVIPNFVAGIEMARPYGFDSPEQAVKSTREGLEFFMSRGIAPRYTVWCPEPLSMLNAHNYGAPLEYHVRLMQAWRDTHEKYNLPVPPGYGNPGKGQAVFSVSGFMDIIRKNT